MLDKVRTALRLDGNDLDEELQDLINACKKDLSTSGIVKISEDDTLILRAVITYCRANFDPTNNDYDRFVKSYESLKNHMCLCSEYTSIGGV